MRNKTIFSVSFLAFVLLLAITAYAAEMAGKCSLCGMNFAGNENTAYEITFNDGKKATYCCAHCGLYVNATETGKVKAARARDFIGGEWMTPDSMTFLFKSSATPACAPSWIAFGKKKEAEKFQKGFGGTIYNSAEALKARAKMPKGMKM
ncbi:MAG: nitrous oxide reductase accessory protein NosL [Desulfobulbaceae bacterium]|nr:nitrous oxide reductase accessory protein NosL [Desulfobulbaceae bacterium]